MAAKGGGGSEKRCQQQAEAEKARAVVAKGGGGNKTRWQRKAVAAEKRGGGSKGREGSAISQTAQNKPPYHVFLLEETKPQCFGTTEVVCHNFFAAAAQKGLNIKTPLCPRRSA